MAGFLGGAYRSDRLSEYDLKSLLGLETRMEVHAFLTEHRVYLHYGKKDLEYDMREADRLVALIKVRNAIGQQPAE